MKFIIATLLVVTMIGCIQTSEGTRVGVVTKFSKKGILCKTWEGTASIGFLRDGQGTVSNEEFRFTVEDLDLVHDVEAAMEQGVPVKLAYSEELITWPCRGDTRHFIASIAEVVE